MIKAPGKRLHCVYLCSWHQNVLRDQLDTIVSEKAHDMTAQTTDLAVSVTRCDRYSGTWSKVSAQITIHFVRNLEVEDHSGSKVRLETSTSTKAAFINA